MLIRIMEGNRSVSIATQSPWSDDGKSSGGSAWKPVCVSCCGQDSGWRRPVAQSIMDDPPLMAFQVNLRSIPTQRF